MISSAKDVLVRILKLFDDKIQAVPERRHDNWMIKKLWILKIKNAYTILHTKRGRNRTTKQSN